MEEKNKSPIYEDAEKDYVKGMKYKDIATKYEVSINTVKSWKTRYNWIKIGAKGTRKGMHTKAEKGCIQSNNKNGMQKEETGTKTIEAKEAMKNGELNENQKLFCIYYSKCFNQTKAYLKAYKCDYMTAAVNASRLLNNAKIRAMVDKLTEVTMDKAALTRGLIQKYIDIAFSDIGEYVEFGIRQVPLWTKNSDGEDIPIVDPNTGEQKIKEYSYVDLKNSIGVDTSIISEVSEGKDGIKFKLADKMKAMDFLNKHCNLLNDEEKTKLELENKRLQNEKAQAEIDKLKGDNIEIEDTDELEGEIYGNS